MSLTVVITTLGSQEEARVLARQLVEERLAACVQITAIESVYRWDDAVETAGEWRLDCKTPSERADALSERIKALHPYDEPEIVVLSADASAGYLVWAEASTR